MTRERISTTVDADRLAQLRRRTGLRDSEIVDRALRSMLADLDGQVERDAIAAAPYDDDPELSWQAPPGPDLPYDGAVPAEVEHLASERRSGYQR